jgi:hypothetical protein
LSELFYVPFAIASREELWSRGRLIERRLDHGQAFDDEHGITARDVADPALVAACDAAMGELRTHIIDDARVRLVAEATAGGVTKIITVTMNTFSIVTTPEHFDHDLKLLRNAGVPPAGPAASRRVPLLWQHGSAAVLLHEVVGHPLEHGHAALDLRPWLEVQVPLRPRRATFKDVPLLRMTDVVARQSNAPFAIPDERIEVSLVDGGAYDPLTQVITLRIAAANLVDGNGVTPLAPFTLTEARADILFLGASGEPLRYPGVICSREGQELVVGSYAPLLLTGWR